MQPQYLGAEYGAGFVLGLLTHVPPHAYIAPRPDTSLRLWAADYIAVPLFCTTVPHTTFLYCPERLRSLVRAFCTT